MAGSSRRYALAVILLPLLFLAMAGLSRAATIHVNTLTSEPVTTPGPLCTLPDAIASSEGTLNNCVPGTGNDTIVFDLTGKIVVDEPLLVTSATSNLVIQGPSFGGIVLDGGGTSQILDHEGANLTLNNLTFQNGFADSGLGFQGGAILANSSGALNINNCTFANNLAGTGGAIFGGFGTITILNSTFANNTADPTILGSGGAIFNNAAAVNIGNCTFSMNHAFEDSGGSLGWASGFPPAVAHSILESVKGIEDSDNCQAPGDVPDLVTDIGLNISDDETCFKSSGTNSKINTALLLDPDGLENNGGPTQTIEPQAGSPAIDFVTIGSCIDFLSNPLLTDQRLFFRPDLDGGSPEAFCDAGAFETNALPPISIVNGSLRLQVATGTKANTDKVNTAFTFIINGAPNCADEDALNDGFELSLFHGTCSALPLNGLMLNLSPFVVHTVNMESYGTLFQKSPPVSLQQATEQVNARMVALSSKPAGSCGEWTLNLEVSGLTVSAPALNLGGGNPYALVLTDIDGDRAGCFDITNAIVGGQLPTPRPGGGTRKVRRK
jgi:hypothetical protein